jgi:iron complex transport system permease protein
MLGAAVLALIVAALVASTVGAVPIGFGHVIAIVLSVFGAPLPADVSAQDATVLLSIRLPRIGLGMAAGAGLSAAGAVLQAIFRNPLADPTLIGVSSGAALAVTAVIVAGDAFVGSSRGSSIGDLLVMLGPFALPLAGFVGGLAATWLLYRVATREGGTSLSTMLLAGIAINALAFAGIGLLTIVASNEQLRNIAFWNFGSVGGARWQTVGVVAVAVIAATVVLTRMAPALNAMALGELEARHLGFATERVKRLVIALAALAAGFVVAVCGVIGFVALVAPHIARSLFGADNRLVIPASASIGALLLLLADLFGRTVAAPAELPIGIVTALIGAPFFLWLLMRQRPSGTLA